MFSQSWDNSYVLYIFMSQIKFTNFVQESAASMIGDSEKLFQITGMEH